jgi:hypothetical protein
LIQTEDRSVAAELPGYDFGHSPLSGAQRRSWVNCVGLTVNPTLPVHPEQRTSACRPGWSGWCQQPNMMVLSGKSGRETRRAVGLSIHLWVDRLKNRTRSAVRELVVLRDRPLQVVVFIAGDETDLFESGEMLFGFR